MFSRHVDAVVVALGWSRTVVIEQGRWTARRTDRKPRGDHVRNVRAVQDLDSGTVFDSDFSQTRTGVYPGSRPRTVVEKRTSFEYEEFGWHKYRSFSARGDSTDDVRWPEYTLQSDQRVSERRETYRAKFSTDSEEYTAELDEATWLALEVGLPCRLKVGALTNTVERVIPVRG